MPNNPSPQQGLRERVARIIDPTAFFSIWEMREWAGTRRASAGNPQKAAFAKADAILSLLPSQGSKEGGPLDAAESPSVAAQVPPSGQIPARLRRAFERASQGQWWAHMDQYKVKAQPPGTCLINNEVTVALCATGEKAAANTALIAEMHAFVSSLLRPEREASAPRAAATPPRAQDEPKGYPPAGWKLVPTHPTDEMVSAAVAGRIVGEDPRAAMAAAYLIMLSTSPDATEAGEGGMASCAERAAITACPERPSQDERGEP